MKRILKLLPVLAVIFILFGCHTSNDDDPDFVPGDAHYDLILRNNTEENIEIFLQGLAGEDFDRRGLLGPDEEMIIQLAVESTYVVRAAAPGAALEDYFFQETITRLNPSDYLVVIND